MTGKIQIYDKANGFGFVAGDDGTEYYTKFDGLTSEEKTKTEEGMAVSFDLQEGMRGLEAINVKLL